MSAVAALCVLLLQGAQKESWKPFFMPGGYSVQAPAPMKAIDRALLDTPTHPESRYWVGITSAAVYVTALEVVYEKDLKDAPPMRALAMFVGGVLEPKGVLRSQRDILLNGWPGLEIEYTDGADRSRFRAYVLGNTIFQAGVGWPDGKPAPAEADRFLSSMLTPDKLGRGPQKTVGPEFAVHELPGGKISLRLPGTPDTSHVETQWPTAKVVVTRHVAGYGDRVFSCAYLDVPDEAIQELVDDEDAILEKLTDEMLSATPAKGRKLAKRTMGKINVLTATAKIKYLTMRADTFRRGNRIYTVYMVAPEFLVNGDEGKAFFDSIKLLD
jgi:hypothetical protein